MSKQQTMDLMQAARVPGAAIFCFEGGIGQVAVAGVRNIAAGMPIDPRTVFQAASLSKPVVAYAALQLVDAGKLDLHDPLSDIVGPLVPGDADSLSISARHVLCHTTGLPNWRSERFPLRSYFTPGSRFSYSGEGFVYLQAAIEKLTGEPLEVAIKRIVFDPLAMQNSSFVWCDSLAEHAALGHRVGLRSGRERILSLESKSRFNRIRYWSAAEENGHGCLY